MTAANYQYLKDTEEKAIKVIKSCKTKAQLRVAKKYIVLLGARYTNEFNLNELFLTKPEDYHLCEGIRSKLYLMVSQRKLSLKEERAPQSSTQRVYSNETIQLKCTTCGSSNLCNSCMRIPINTIQDKIKNNCI